MRGATLIVVFLLNIGITSSQITLSGPMKGHTTAHSTNLWLLTKAKEDSIQFSIKNASIESISIEKNCSKRWCSYNLHLSNLKQNLNYELKLNTKRQSQTFSFNTTSNTDNDSLEFLLGSCSFRWGPLQMVVPGNGFKVFKQMQKEDAELMLWMGDNVYYLLRDLKNETNMFRENVRTRKKKHLNGFLQSKMHYSIWDDHDYGPNNSLSNYPLKSNAKSVFTSFWSNPDYPKEGIYYAFKQKNTAFFMLDGRWFRTNPNDKNPSLIGQKQLEWLKKEIKELNADYNFIILGSQVINPLGADKHERLSSYKNEFDALTALAQQHSNVIFLSGDMHYTALFKNEDYGKALYEFSCSPLSSYPYKIKKRNSEYKNPYMVEGSNYHRQNYGKITISKNGCTFQTFNKKGEKIWSYTIP